MFGGDPKKKIAALLQEVDIEINGPRPTDIRVADERVYRRLAAAGPLAFGESFMDGWWDVDDLATVVDRLRRKNRYDSLVGFDAWLLSLHGRLVNLQSRARSFAVGERHYDLGNDLYTAMLGNQMAYSCAAWDGTGTLEEAQERKFEMICEKLGLKAGDRILDIGCGWGSFMNYAAKHHGVRCVGLTVSAEQAEFGKRACAGLPIEFAISDYRAYRTREPFDHLVSIEMFEAVGPKNMRAYFVAAARLLKPSGRFFFQTSGSLDAVPTQNAWLHKHIFPNGILPSLPQIERSSRGLFRIDELTNIGPSYDLILHEWWRRFDAAYETLTKNDPKYDERFYRMWKFYLLGCAGFFRSGVGQDWQIVLSPARYT